MVGILITTIGIVVLVLAVVGASIEVYAQLLSTIIRQELSAIPQQMPAILQPVGETTTAGESRPPFDSTDILSRLEVIS